MRMPLLLVAGVATGALALSTLPASADGEDLISTGAGSGRPAAAPQAVPPQPAAAAAGVVVGTNDGSIATTSCSPGGTSWVQYGTDAATPSYTVPGAGVITSYSHLANAAAGSIRATWYGAAAVPTDRTVISTSALLPVTPSVMNTWPARVSVPAGATLGIFVSAAGMACVAQPTVPADVTMAAIVDPSTTSNFTPVATFASHRVHLSAVWEPDVDGDGYGDASQDLCPESKQTQSACPAPETTVTKKPKKKSTKRKAKIKFTSSVPGSTFLCAVDKKAAKPCTSPFKKRFKYGKHKVVITAVSPFGIVEGTPVKVKFKIVRPD